MSDTTLPVDLPQGRTTIDDKLTFEPERLSYVAAVRVAALITADVANDIQGQAVVIARDTFLADLSNLAAAKVQLGLLADDYRSVSESLAPSELEGAALTRSLDVAAQGVTVGVQAALGLASLLREDVDLRGVPTKVDALAFEIALAQQLRTARAARVVIPDLTVMREPVSAADSLQAKWQAMQDARQAAWRAAAPLLAELGAADAALDAATRNNATSEIDRLSREVFAIRRRVEPLTETLGRADRRLGELQAQWDKADTTGLTLLARLLRAEVIDAPRPKYLHAAVVASGGHHRVSRHLLRLIFLGDGVTSMGGVVVRWALLESDGAFVKGGIRAARESAKFPGPWSPPDVRP